MKHGSSGYKSGCRCDVCKAGKSADARRHYLAHREEYLERAKRQAEQNPDRVREYKQQHYQRNRDDVLAAQREPDVRLVRAARQRDYQRRNADKIRAYKRDYEARNREAINARSLAWLRSPAGRAAVHRRRGVPFTPAAREYLDIILGDPCVYCGAATESIDHIVPISRGGTGDWDNVAPCCKSCNSKKHARPLLAFLLREANR